MPGPRDTQGLAIGAGLSILLGFMVLGYLGTQVPNGPLKVPTRRVPFQLTAPFNNVGGLKVGAPVKISGVKVGVVADIHLDRPGAPPLVALHFREGPQVIPQDSTASILALGLLGGTYVDIRPGGSTTLLRDGERIVSTRSPQGIDGLAATFLTAFKAKHQAASVN
jgi:phospholipid/cholesterol/gamma-HCH transport system substrate-binding protein